MVFVSFYEKSVVKYPKTLLTVMLMAIAFLGYHARDFKLDASAESLMLEHDKTLQYSRLIYERYKVLDYLIISYKPKEDLFSEKTINTLANLRDELKQMERVQSVLTILDVPLLESPPVPIKEIAKNIQSLESKTVDRNLARLEFQHSPLYQNLLISKDLKTCSVVIHFKLDTVYQTLLKQRNDLRDKRSNGQLSPAEEAEFKTVIEQFNQRHDLMSEERHKDIAEVRKIIATYRNDAEIFLGGVQMIADDMITFVKNDLQGFGTIVFLIVVLALSIIFKRLRWIILPVACCIFSTLCMMGFLGIFDWRVTVISSNFISLQLIYTISLVVHLIMRYHELLSQNPSADKKTLILETVYSKFSPSLYSVLTTIAGFSSLIFSGILPVINFGWMMSAGVISSMIIIFLIFPTVVMILKKEKPLVMIGSSKQSYSLFFAKLTIHHGTAILIITIIASILITIGISRLFVENSFIDYFRQRTEIYQGMKFIDQNLGGTTPFDLTVDLEPSKPAEVKVQPTDAVDEFEEFDKEETGKNAEKYWFTSSKIEKVIQIHNYLESLPETGKVLSIGTMMKIAEKFNGNKPLDNFQLALLYSALPHEFKDMILSPYVSIEHNQVRFSIRVKDSEKSLKRNAFLNQIRYDLTHKLGFKEDQVHLSGMLVLYNNMLRNLYNSQILLIGVTVVSLILMFLILFRDVKIAIIGFMPNLLASGSILGVMGWLKIPLDMMTITIMSISMGMAVDNAIHYLYRFQEEIKLDYDYSQAVIRSHSSLAYAMSYSSVIIVTGFSILSFSNFIPTIYFGLLTGLAMLVALLSALLLLPSLLILLKPYRRK
ncbi:MAG: MMPL family transporter [Desulfobacterales bacterium]|nr:MMPL family transporter [Desulfobacterales bacterium]